MNLKKTINLIVVLILIMATITALYGVLSNQSINENQIIKTMFEDTVSLYGKGLYHNESISMASQVLAQEMVTLCIVVPFLIFSLIVANKDNLKGKMLLSGILGYLLYTYATYCFVAVYNNFFLVYVLLMSLTFFGFALSIYQLIILRKNIKFSKLPNRYIGYSTVFFGVLILFMWLGKLVPPLIQNTVPSDLEHYTTFPIQALDIAIIVPITIITGIAFSKKKLLGYLLSPIIAIKGIMLFLAIDAMMISMLLNDVVVDIIELLVFSIFTLLYCFNLYLIMKNVHVNNHIASIGKK